MKASEKKQIYDLLHVISDNLYGFSSKDFPEDIQFSDDDSPKEKIISIKAEETSSSTAGIEKINEKIKSCTRCPLCQKKINYVPGMGVSNPEVLVIGEGPGEEEDKAGLPFVGPAGQLLDKMLNAINLDRKANCYIANVVKCRPPMNRDPLPEEAMACKSFLEAQIHALKPKMILLVGKVSAHDILQNDFSISQMRQRLYDYNGIPCVVTYHPSALLRNQEYKRPAWEDLKFFRSKLIELSPEYDMNFKNKQQ